jgi:hypothetical protein
VYSSSDELAYEEWEAKEFRRLKEAEHRDPLPLACLRLDDHHCYICIIYVCAFVLSYLVGMTIPSTPFVSEPLAFVSKLVKISVWSLSVLYLLVMFVCSVACCIVHGIGNLLP